MQSRAQQAEVIPAHMRHNCISCGKVTEEKYIPLRSVRYRLPPRSDLYYEGGQQGREGGGEEGEEIFTEKFQNQNSSSSLTHMVAAAEAAP